MDNDKVIPFDVFATLMKDICGVDSLNPIVQSNILSSSKTVSNIIKWDDSRFLVDNFGSHPDILLGLYDLVGTENGYMLDRLVLYIPSIVNVYHTFTNDGKKIRLMYPNGRDGRYYCAFQPELATYFNGGHSTLSTFESQFAWLNGELDEVLTTEFRKIVHSVFLFNEYKKIAKPDGSGEYIIDIPESYWSELFTKTERMSRIILEKTL